MTPRVVLMVSGGVSSYIAGKRAVARWGYDTVGIFADTGIEDQDTYRFVEESTKRIGVPLVQVADGRTIWQVFRDERFLGNSRVDPCSRILKRELMDAWVNEHAPGAIEVFGFDCLEGHRLDRMRRVDPSRRIEAPLLDPPYLSKAQILAEVLADGLEPPRLYAMGFEHNNCGGGCVKAGQASFALLYRVMPDRYREWEAHEQEMRQFLGKNVTILRDRKTLQGKQVSKPLTLAAFRERLEAKGSFDQLDWGTCGCFQVAVPGEARRR